MKLETNFYKTRAFRKGVETFKWFSRHHLLMPRFARVEITKLCNLKCVGCRRTLDGNISRQPGKKHLDIKQLELITSQMPLAVVLFGGDGEPTLTPHFIELLRYLASKGIKPGFVTNGTLLNAEMARACRECNVIRVGVSMNGATKETFEKLRIGAKWERILETLELLKDNHVPFFLNSVLFSSKVIEEMPELIRIGKETSAAGISLMKPMVSEIPGNADFVPLDFSKLGGELKEIKATIKASGLQYEGQLNPTPTFRECWDAWTHPFITLNGDVYGCQYTANQRTQEWYAGEIVNFPSSNFIMGNIFKQPIKDIWRGEAYTNLRNYLKKTSHPNGTRISRAELVDIRSKIDKEDRFGYCTGCLYRWGEAGS